MKFIYVKNYLEITREEKLNFFKFIGSVDNLTITQQRVVFSENSLLLDLIEATNVQKAKETIEGFFESISNVSAHVVNQIIQDKDSVILEFNNKKLRVERDRA
jgi:hypothetical protein